MRVAVRFAWYDFWIGFYWDSEDEILYVCPVPMLLIEIQSARSRWKAMTKKIVKHLGNRLTD